MLKYFDKAFLGIQQQKELSTEIYPLGFMTPYDTDAAYEKRKSTVVSWTRGTYVQTKDTSDDYEGIILDNVPQSGFRIAGSVSRWSTENKAFNVQDPRGFTLQIYADNLYDLRSEEQHV